MSSTIKYSKDDIETFIDEKRKEIDARFTIWSTRLRAQMRSGSLQTMSDLAVMGVADDCSCNQCSGGGSS